MQANEESHRGGREEEEEREHQVPTTDKERKKSVVSTSEVATDTVVHRDQTHRLMMNKNKTKLFKIYNIETKEGLAQTIEELKQKISAKTQRLARHKKRQDQYYHNKLFKTDCKKCYNRLGKIYRIVKDAPDKERIENFWREIYEKQATHSGEACWIKDQEQPQPNMKWKQVNKMCEMH